MPRVEDLINRQKELTGSALVKAIKLGQMTPHAGPGMAVAGRGAEATIRQTKRQIIPKVRGNLFPAIVGGSFDVVVNQWKYAWKQAKLDDVDPFRWVVLSATEGGLSSTATDIFLARNFAETANTATVALRGMDTTHPVAVITVRPIAEGSVVPNMQLIKHPTAADTFESWFDAPNAITATCAGASPQQIPLVPQPPRVVVP